MEKIKITKQEFENALELIKKYKIQERKIIEIKKPIVEQILELDKKNIKRNLDFIFKEKDNLKYAEVVNRMHYFLNNVLLIKIGIRNVKFVFKEYLKSNLIKSKGVLFSSFNIYYKNNEI